MVTKEIAQKTGRGQALMAALVAIVAFTGAPGTAYANDYGHHHAHGGWGGGGVRAGDVDGVAIARSALGIQSLTTGKQD